MDWNDGVEWLAVAGALWVRAGGVKGTLDMMDGCAVDDVDWMMLSDVMMFYESYP